MNQRTVLWIGDAVYQTGFARVLQNVAPHLIDRDWKLVVMGLNYDGDPHSCPFPVFPAATGGDPMGFRRLPKLIPHVIRPDVIVINNDPWQVMKYLQFIHPSVPVVAYMPVDAPNQPAGAKLNRLAHAILYTEFGVRELRRGGYEGPATVIPHGVDTRLYKLGDRMAARKAIGLDVPDDAFVVLNCNRNSPRKRLDLTIAAWTQWWVDAGQPKDAYLHIHAADNDAGWSVQQLAHYYGIASQFRMTDPKMSIEKCLPEAQMPNVYRSADVQVTTTGGEGWGLTTHEGMACGIPQIVPRYSALGEWCDGAVEFVEAKHYAATTNGINTIAGFPDPNDVADALEKLYSSPVDLSVLGHSARKRAVEDRFAWPLIGAQFSDVLGSVVRSRATSAQGIVTPASA